MFPHEIYVEIMKYIDYSDQGPIRCSCKALSKVDLTFEQATSVPVISEFAWFLFKQLDLLERTGKSCLFASANDIYNEINQIYFRNGVSSSCISVFECKYSVEYRHTKTFVPSEIREFKTRGELIELLTGYKFELGLNSLTYRFFRLLSKERPFHNYDIDKYCVQSCVSKFRTVMYEGSCRKQYAFLEVVYLFDDETQDKIGKMVDDAYGEYESQYTFDDDCVPGVRFDEIVEFVLGMISNFGTEGMSWLRLR